MGKPFFPRLSYTYSNHTDELFSGEKMLVQLANLERSAPDAVRETLRKADDERLRHFQIRCRAHRNEKRIVVTCDSRVYAFFPPHDEIPLEYPDYRAVVIRFGLATVNRMVEKAEKRIKEAITEFEREG